MCFRRSFRCGWLRRREWDCVGELLGFAAGCVAPTRAQVSQAVSASCHCNQNFCPPSGSDTHLQIRRVPRSAATWADVIPMVWWPLTSLMMVYWCIGYWRRDLLWWLHASKLRKMVVSQDGNQLLPRSLGVSRSDRMSVPVDVTQV